MNTNPNLDVPRRLNFDTTETEQPPAEIDILELIRSLWRGKWWIALFTFVALCIGVYYAKAIAEREYSAVATVALESREEQFVALDSVVSGLSSDQSTINTEVEVLRSRGLMEKLVRKLNLVEDPEFNARLREPPKFSIGIAIGYVSGLLSREPAEPAPPPDERKIFNSVVNATMGAFTISSVRQSYVFNIRAVTKDAEKAALLANTLADLYILDQLEVKFDASEKATIWLTERVDQLQVQLEEAELKVKEFNAGTDLISPEALLGLNRQLKETRDRAQLGAEDAAAAKARYEALKTARDAGDIERLTVLANDVALTRIFAAGENGGTLDRQAFDARSAVVLARANAEAVRLDKQAIALRVAVDNQAAQIESQSEDLLELQQLQREAEASRLIYEYFLNRLKETSVQEGIQQADSRILSPAIIPNGPSAPRLMLILAMSGFLGVLGGGAFVLLRELAQNTFRLPEELEKATGITVIGQIPLLPSRRRKNVLKYLKDRPNSAAAEAVRSLRTSLLMTNIDNPPQIIMSTSSIPSEGKTTQSLALAQNLAGLDKKVLLIEGDIRRQVFKDYFGSDTEHGLLPVLMDEVALEDAVHNEPSLNADVLFAGKVKANAADLFSSSKFQNFLTSLREKYDYVVIDTPPVLAVPDARVIGRHVDAIAYSVKWDSTTRRQLREGLRQFQMINIKVSGLVLSQISPRGMKRYGYGDSYGNYGGYYHN